MKKIYDPKNRFHNLLDPAFYSVGEGGESIHFMDKHFIPNLFNSLYLAYDRIDANAFIMIGVGIVATVMRVSRPF